MRKRSIREGGKSHAIRSFEPHLHSHNDVAPSNPYSRILGLRYAFNISSHLNQINPFHYQINTASPSTIKMPVPMPSTTEKSTSAPATAQTTHDVENKSTQSVASASHTEKTEQEKEAERLYEERMEEEYAKREGGA